MTDSGLASSQSEQVFVLAGRTCLWRKEGPSGREMAESSQGRRSERGSVSTATSRGYEKGACEVTVPPVEGTAKA